MWTRAKLSAVKLWIVSRRAAETSSERWRVGRWGNRVRREGEEEVMGLVTVVLWFSVTCASRSSSDGIERVAIGMYNSARTSGIDFVL